MSSVTVEEISPEVVLVCPELREQALALLPELPWERAASRARDRVPERAATPSASALRDAVAALLQLGQVATIVVVATILLTLGLTVVADLTR